MMSLILMATTVFPNINVNQLVVALGLVLAVLYLGGAVFLFFRRGANKNDGKMSREQRSTWRMPSLNLLERPKWSRGRLAGMYVLRGYLVVAVILLLVKAVQLGLHR